MITLHGDVAAGEQSAAGITGSAITYTVTRGDTLSTIAAQFGVYPETIAFDNGLDARRPLQAGRELYIDSRHLVPELLTSGEILVNVPQRMVFYRDGDRVLAYPIAVGRPTWRTPLGPFAVVRMEQDPAWHVPESIRAESAAAGHVLPAVVPPGPTNPLGRFWIGLSLASIGIHGTPFPSSIYKTTTHGCIRLRADHIDELYSHVRVGTRGQVIYQPLLMAVVGHDVFIEVHPDIYRRLPVSALEQAHALAAQLGVHDRIDWTEGERAIARRAGVARRVSAPR